MRSVVIGVAGLIAAVLAPPALAAPDDLACHQEPGSRFYWVERAFCDLEMAGPQRAHSLVIWNHGISGTTESWRAPAAPVLRLIQVRGWDVIMLKRHHLAETMPGGPLDRTVKRTLAEAAAQRQAGYKKIVLAGQSCGGYVTMEAIDTAPDIDAAIAFSPGVRVSGASGALDPAVVERILERARVGRLAVVFPKNDALFGNIARGVRARPILAKRDFPWLMVDETSPGDIVGHGGGVTGRFALRYGACLAEFLGAVTPAPGQFPCERKGDDARVVRDLLLPLGTRLSLATNDADVPPQLRPFLGGRWALLGDTVALVAPVVDRGKVRLVYRTAGASPGIYDAVVADGVVTAILRNKATVQLSADGDGTIIWTSADRSITLKGSLTRVEDP